MSNKKLDGLVAEMENYVECWKQFKRFIDLAQSKKFTQEDENQFLDTKSILVQGLELIIATLEGGTPPKEEILSIITGAPSIRYISELNDGGRNLENQWHKIYIQWQSLLGQLKVQQRQAEGKGLLGGLGLFGKS
ncbi:MAG TPA: hypothetical protein VEH27_12555 [Methylomirabilota bacterium]|nr:hypothetical protein [Methylomirabilota bacterium]